MKKGDKFLLEFEFMSDEIEEYNKIASSTGAELTVRKSVLKKAISLQNTEERWCTPQNIQGFRKGTHIFDFYRKDELGTQKVLVILPPQKSKAEKLSEELGVDLDKVKKILEAV